MIAVIMFRVFIKSFLKCIYMYASITAKDYYRFKFILILQRTKYLH